MSILIDKNTRVMVQGITGKSGSLQAKAMLDAGTNIVAGVTPGKGGQEVYGIPVYNYVAEARRAHDFDTVICFVPPRVAKDSCFEAIDAGIRLLVLTTEEIALHDVVEIDAGDTYAYDTDGLKTQKAREDAAKQRIYSLLPDDQKRGLMAVFDEFEADETAEAHFAHAMDNLQPLLLNNSNGGSDWADHDVTAKQVYGRQSRTEKGSAYLYKLTDNILQANIKKGALKEK